MRRLEQLYIKQDRPTETLETEREKTLIFLMREKENANIEKHRKKLQLFYTVGTTI